MSLYSDGTTELSTKDNFITNYPQKITLENFVKSMHFIGIGLNLGFRFHNCNYGEILTKL